jgi:hypothetical protein
VSDPCVRLLNDYEISLRHGHQISSRHDMDIRLV